MLVRRPPPRALTASLLRRAQRGYTASDVEVARKAIAARRPQPEATDSTRVLYSPRVQRTFADLVTGRWRGHPIDLNHSHEDWARRESSDRHIRHVLTTFRSATFRRLLYPDLAVTTSISASVVLHNLLVAWEHEHTMTVESIERHGFDLLLHHEMITLPVEPFTMLSVALGLVLSVRTNRAYERFIEARVLLGSMTNVLPSAPRLTAVNLPRTLHEPSRRSAATSPLASWRARAATRRRSRRGGTLSAWSLRSRTR